MEPHYKNPSPKTAYVAFCYRDFKEYAAGGGTTETSEHSYFKSHRGLGVNAMLMAKVLRKNGVRADVVPCGGAGTLRTYLSKNPAITHAVIQALWIGADDQQALCRDFPAVHFLVRVHSQVGFLQVEPAAITILRGLLLAQEMQLNLGISANSSRLHRFLQHTYKSKVPHLPNLYDLDRVQPKNAAPHEHRLLRIGSFGALRLLKNHTTAAAAAMMIAERRGCDLEFYINGSREEHGGEKGGIRRSLEAMFANVRWAKLVEVPWEEWPSFRQTIAHMDLNLAPSFTETFCIVAADSVAEGVPVVTSSAIEWTPQEWWADADDAEAIARVGSYLLSDRHAAEEGLCALRTTQAAAVGSWLGYLGENPTV